VDPQTRKVDWLALNPGSPETGPEATAGAYKPIEHSNLIDLGPAQLTSQVDWPPLAD